MRTPEVDCHEMLCSHLEILLCVCVVQAALAVWICILRFMGDMPEPKYRAQTQPAAEKEKVSSNALCLLLRMAHCVSLGINSPNTIAILWSSMNQGANQSHGIE